MSVSHLRAFHEEAGAAAPPAWAVLLSSYSSGATEGKRLGTAGYSYDFVARLFAPLLQRLGKLVDIKNPRAELPSAIESARKETLEPVHVVFRPFQDAYLAPSVRNVVVPAWEFPDIPNDPFDGNPQNDWVDTANRCSLVLVGGPFTAKALESAGVRTPIRIVPVPTPETYFDVPRWHADGRTTIDCSPYVLPDVSGAMPTLAVGMSKAPQDHHMPTTSVGMAPRSPCSYRHRLAEAIRVTGLQTYRRFIKPLLPPRIGPMAAAMLRAGVTAWQEQSLPRRREDGLNLGGVVYTSIFNPDDGRKNWEDMVTAFLYALRDCEDATLVLKLIVRSRESIHRVLSFYRRLNVSHRCRLVLIPDFLSEADMQRLLQASTFYLTSTRAEGNCLPVMNYLAAGRPCISPAHTAIADYFDSDVGFVVESHPEPCCWPQDSRRRWRTTWHRLVWPSLVEQIRRSYRVAKEDQAAYEKMAAAGRDRMRQWAHPEAVWRQLRSAVETLASDVQPAPPDGGSRSGILPLQNGVESCPRQEEAARNAAGCRVYAAAPTRVAVSLLSFRPGKIGGTETYLRQLIARLPEVDRRHEIVLLMDRDLAAQNVFPGMERAVVDLSAREVMAARALEAVTPYRARAVEKALDRLRPDVVLFPQQSMFPKNVAAPCVLVVHDLYHIFLPQYLSPVQRVFRGRNYAYSISRADRIIAISQFTKKTVLEQYGVSPERVAVVPHGWEAAGAEHVEADPESGRKYLYYPAITRPHKNHHVLLESIAALRSQGCFDYDLVLSGIQTPHWKTLQKQIHKLGLDQTVRHEGYVSYDRVRQLYRGAECVVFPTSFEGFGLPVLEAAENGKKILVSRLEVFDEIGVPERFQIDFADPVQLYRGLQEPGITVLENRPWTWEESAAATMAVLDLAAGREAVPARSVARAA